MFRSLSIAALVAGAATVCIACEKVRPTDAEGPCVGYVDDVQPLLEQRCVGCHGRDRTEGSVDISSYSLVLEAPPMRLVDKVDVGDGLDPHSAPELFATTLSDWVTRCDVAFRVSRIHEPGILNPEAPDFHGKLIADDGYDFEACAKCHGPSFAGGTSKSSCLTCHVDGPTDCAVCHGADRADAPHQTHAHIDCGTCHAVPGDWNSRGHLDAPPAEVQFFGLATADLPDHPRTAPAAYDFGTSTCTNVYCHGGVFDDANALEVAPQWTAPRDDSCGTCHGLAPSDHADDECTACHQRAIDDDGRVDAALHVDGAVSVGRDDTCQGCHDETTGRHQAHLNPRLRVGAAVACTDCHAVPETVTAPGHLDTALPAELFVDEILANSLAARDAAMPDYDPSSGTCTNVYCHGAGTAAAADTAPSKVLTLDWNSGPVQQVFCGSCHGIPPQDGFHDQNLSVERCIDCHPRSVDAFGNVLFDGGESEHLDGETDL